MSEHLKGVHMPSFKKLTPNLIVSSVERSLAFYVGVLGFEHGMTVPEQSPFVFASVTSGAVEIFVNDAATAVKEYPGFAGKPLGSTGTLFIELDESGEKIDGLHDRIKGRVKVTMPLVTQFYGMREFAIEDPDGYVITFAQRVQG
ncbi:MAG TPA: VOC family protein [Vicinamibacterales bacterium]|nr:VOC family protein [Vicinamibacterales bacterium]